MISPNTYSAIQGHRWVSPAALFCGVLFIAAEAMVVPTALAAERPNILVILVDDMGYGDPGCYNPDSKIRTPNIDSLAIAGTRFTDAHAAGPLCHMSRYGLMTGRYPFRINVSKWPTEPLIQPNQLTLPKMLQQAGYQTAMVGKWHLGFNELGGDRERYQGILSGGPVDCGFDSFFGIRASTDIPPYFYIRDNRAVSPPTETIQASQSEGWSPIQGAFWRAGKIAKDLDLSEVLPKFTDEAITVIEQQAQPWMLYLAYPAPHTPWLPSEKFAGKSQAGMYGDFMEMTDAMIGRVLDALKASGAEENTLVIFTSDNGPTWYDRDVEQFGHDSMGPLRGMKGDAFEAGHRVPFIAKWPGRVPAGETRDSMICFTDLLATLATIVDQPIEDSGPLDSIDFSPALMGNQPSGHLPRTELVIQSATGMICVRDDRWKWMDGLGSGGFSKPQRIEAGVGEPDSQLYDLDADLGESNNLAQTRTDVVERLRSILRAVKAPK